MKKLLILSVIGIFALSQQVFAKVAKNEVNVEVANSEVQGVVEHNEDLVKKSAYAKSVFAPQWSDICPYAAYFSIDVNKNYKKVDKKYWKERRIQFDKEIAACASQKDIPLADCYDSVVALEAERTAAWATNYKDEKNARLAKGGIFAAWTAILGAFTCLGKWW